MAFKRREQSVVQRWTVLNLHRSPSSTGTCGPDASSFLKMDMGLTKMSASSTCLGWPNLIDLSSYMASLCVHSTSSRKPQKNETSAKIMASKELGHGLSLSWPLWWELEQPRDCRPSRQKEGKAFILYLRKQEPLRGTQVLWLIG